jgi:hypothetical protein
MVIVPPGSLLLIDKSEAEDSSRALHAGEGATDREGDAHVMRGDGTLRNPVTMWVVRHGDDLYVRSVYGRRSSWFRGAQTRHEARIHAGGVDRDVLLVETDAVNDELDVAR